MGVGVCFQDCIHLSLLCSQSPALAILCSLFLGFTLPCVLFPSLILDISPLRMYSLFHFPKYSALRSV